ncbi:quinone oxidoreductase [Ferrovum sp. PN-J185]|uniref:quinone oxidoreductase family protein n=1 Tax=Ferrovum sp. PN-J185 TaxID=1356306 RepID=UPI00079A17E9|nr:quinone oxidoreductase [Ferrovum sp. PN-J185]KXW56887.1 quinone oxidoreductase 1 [Ferrovum sp. PN-J185]MCC6069245.1 quinone oxidoreductase [Ferrovum sp. PN-J185]
MPHAIRFHQPGGPEVFKWEEVEVAQPKAGEVLLKHTAVGLNYIDVYHRTGLYPAPLPAIPGLEAAGVIQAVGDGVTDLKVGDRVAYASGPLGAYSQERTMAADRVVKLPASISDEQGAAMMLQGLTAQYLLRRTYPVKAGDTILVHAAAGGVGLILCQWARHLGVKVIGTVGSEEKAQLAKQFGCDYPIIYTKEDFQEKVLEITNGKKVPVVYDSVGKDTFLKSLDCLSPLGLLVLFGQSSGNVPPFDLGQLSVKGSLFITRPTLATYTAKREDLVNGANELFDVVSKGIVKINVNQRYALQDAAQAHRDLEARKTTGSTIFTV